MSSYFKSRLLDAYVLVFGALVAVARVALMMANSPATKKKWGILVIQLGGT